jgi:hypothetical protein
MSEENRHRELIRVRHQLQGTLGEKFDEGTWAWFQYQAHEHLDDPIRLPWEDLVGLAEDALIIQRQHEREVLEKHGLTREPREDASGVDLGSSKPEHFEPILRTELDEREKQRIEVVLKIGMRQAAERPDVRRFRDERLGRQRILFDEAEAFISPGWPEEIRDGELAELARRLERDYGWRQNEAAWFVLNGARPRLLALNTRYSIDQRKHGPSSCKITLEVAPWIPSKVVEKAFMQARDALRGGSGPGTVGERKLGVLGFVEDEHAKRGRRPPFGELLELWNREHPHWLYTDYRALSKAYRQAYQEVFHPRYRMPGEQHPEVLTQVDS